MSAGVRRRAEWSGSSKVKGPVKVVIKLLVTDPTDSLYLLFGLLRKTTPEKLP